jgi:signal transduction histidine kinase
MPKSQAAPRFRAGVPRSRTSLALVTAYAINIALLVFSLVEAYRVQSAVSEQNVESYRLYVRQDAAVVEIRRTLWLAGNFVRDYLIHATPETALVLEDRLRQVRSESEVALRELGSLNPSVHAPSELSSGIADFWAAAGLVPRQMQNAGSRERYDFVQREIAPRRSTLYSALARLTTAERDALQEGESQFSMARRAAGRRLLFVLGIGAVLSMVVAGFSVTHARRLERRTALQHLEVGRAKQELEELSARLVAVEEEWKKNLSRELHDEVGQALAALQIDLAAVAQAPGAGSSEVRTGLKRVSDAANRLVGMVRNISLLLRPALLDDLGLAPALEWLTEDFTRRTGIPCEFRNSGVPETLPESHNTCVYRIVQESLHNTEKHAAARSAVVTVRGSAAAVEVEVFDNGKGFAWTGGRAPGLGLLGMRERAARLDGSLAIETNPGRGTRIQLTLPLPETNRTAQAGG